jgi:hemerythrin-like domain-containing protein
MSGPNPAALPSVLACLAEEHRHMRALLKLLELRASQRAALELADYYLMRDIVAYLHDYPDQVHHPTEDLLFTRLGKLRPDLRSEIESVKNQHRQLARASSRLLEDLEAATSAPAIRSEQAIRKRVQSFALHQQRHMQRENRSLFAAALAELKPADWKALSRRAHLHEDPLFGSTVQSRHRSLFEFLLDADRLFPLAVANSAMDTQERLIAAVTAIEQGGQQGLAIMRQAAGSLIEETRARLSGAKQATSLLGLMTTPWQFGWVVARTFGDCSWKLLGISATTTRQACVAVWQRPRE